MSSYHNCLVIDASDLLTDGGKTLRVLLCRLRHVAEGDHTHEAGITLVGKNPKGLGLVLALRDLNYGTGRRALRSLSSVTTKIR